MSDRQVSLAEYFTPYKCKRTGAEMEATPATPELMQSKRACNVYSTESSENVVIPQFVRNEEPPAKEDDLAREFEYTDGEGEADRNMEQEDNKEKEKGKPRHRKKGSRPKSYEKFESGPGGSNDKEREKSKDRWELPVFMRPENILDKNQCRPNDPQFDPSSVFIPEADFSAMTPTVKQYWQIKRDNMDKIVLFKLGKFYELFNEDAAICHKVLDLNWTGPLHVGFPEKCLDKYGSILVNMGYKVIVAEQMESPREMKKRLQGTKGKNKKDEKTMKREICKVLSKGVYVNPSNADYEAKYILSIYTDHTSMIGIAILDIAALKIKIGQFEDDKFLCKFRTLCTRLRPVEVLYNRDGLRPELRKILQNSPILPVFSPLAPESGTYNYIRSIPMLEKYFGPDPTAWPHALASSKANLWQGAISAFGIAIGYLEDCLLASQIITTAEYEIFDLDTSLLFTMTLDSQALQHLEVLEVQGRTKNVEQGSLLNYLDRTRTPFGRREIKRWLCAPLFDIEDIMGRQEAVSDFLMNPDVLAFVRERLVKLPDLEKKISRLYTYSVKQEKSPVFFENVNVKKLNELKEVLEVLKTVLIFFRELEKQRSKLESKRLRGLTGSAEKGEGLVPDFEALIAEFEGVIDWTLLGKGREGDRVPEPNGGVDQDYDEAGEKIRETQKLFEDELVRWQEFFGDSTIVYVHRKYRYELEISDSHIKRMKPKELEFTSRRDGFQRFHTPKIRGLLDQLEDAEDRREQSITPFICRLFSKFHDLHLTWSQVIRCLSELDCLASLAAVSSAARMCKPEFVNKGENENRPYLELRQLRHPCIVETGLVKFVPNDTVMGELLSKKSENQRVLLVTGPNMGGKSTILRQTCIAVIMAQMGCYVPAEKCLLTPVDRIFTRIGASDRLLEGKSTFFVEMEEAKNVVEYATSESLVIMDELGRGTSTFDGLAIAQAVLECLVNRIKCRSLFSTHYHLLVERFKEYKEIGLYYMQADVNEETDEICFKYKFTPGICPKSFGIQVAKLAGLPAEILELAKSQSRAFVKKMEKVLPAGVSSP